MMTVYVILPLSTTKIKQMHTKKDSTRQTTKAPRKKQNGNMIVFHARITCKINIDKLEEGGGKGEEKGPSIHVRRLRRRKSPQRNIQKKTKDL
mmetsp:Transcript_16768/g.24924  ORF Transcript_16768/g.24924 Transcript_16768/m.24924 type:complete len:93 (-) Transcript_16768:13-291(-)